MREIKVRLFHEHLPAGAGGMCCLDPKTGEYMVIINADRSREEQVHSFLHEMLHIYNEDFSRVDSGVSVSDIEKQTNDQLRSIGF